MNILSKVFKWIGASGLVISTLFIFNLYFVLDADSMDDAQCIALFNSKNVKFCYNFMKSSNEFCPIGSYLGE